MARKQRRREKVFGALSKDNNLKAETYTKKYNLVVILF